MRLKPGATVALLFGLYLFAYTLSWLTERWMPAVSSGQANFRITLRHFQQPKDWGITPRSLKVFLGRVTDGRPGVFAAECLYEGLLGAYLILNLLLLVRITRRTPTRQGLGVDLVLRYAPIVDKLRSCVMDARILEIGPGIAGIAEFLDKNTVIGIDNRSINQSILPHNLRMIQASVLSAPFTDSSFDYVVCVDVIEHLAPAERSALIKEALRITKNTLFMATPSGGRTVQAERFVYSALAPLYRVFHKDLSFLREHLENGLPEREDLLRAITACAPGAQVSVSGNVNLYIWIFCMYLDPLVRWTTKYTGIGWLRRMLSPFASFLSFGPKYRLVFVVRKPS